MKVVIASQSPVKVEAVMSVFLDFFDNVDFVPVKAASHVSDQPFNQETLQGARNRLANAKKEICDGDYYVSIENGIFQEDDRYVDRAIAVITDISGHETVTASDGVDFPALCVDEAKRRGFGNTTVGKVMQEMGIIKQHNDPHIDLAGKSRETYIKEILNTGLTHLLGKGPLP